jgi:hypothetical protein
MNFGNYERWLKTKLIQNFLPNLALIVDNTAHHKVQHNPALTSSSGKNDMIDWVSYHGIPFIDQMCKAELYFLTKMHKP